LLSPYCVIDFTLTLATLYVICLYIVNVEICSYWATRPYAQPYTIHIAIGLQMCQKIPIIALVARKYGAILLPHETIAKLRKAMKMNRYNTQHTAGRVRYFWQWLLSAITTNAAVGYESVWTTKRLWKIDVVTGSSAFTHQFSATRTRQNKTDRSWQSIFVCTKVRNRESPTIYDNRTLHEKCWSLHALALARWRGAYAHFAILIAINS